MKKIILSLVILGLLASASFAAFPYPNYSTVDNLRVANNTLFNGQIGQQGYMVVSANAVSPNLTCSINMTSTCSVLIINNAATVGTVNITLPVYPIDGSLVRLTSEVEVTALTVTASASTGQVVKNAPTSLSAGGVTAFLYRLAAKIWDRI